MSKIPSAVQISLVLKHHHSDFLRFVFVIKRPLLFLAQTTREFVERAGKVRFRNGIWKKCVENPSMTHSGCSSSDCCRLSHKTPRPLSFSLAAEVSNRLLNGTMPLEFECSKESRTPAYVFGLKQSSSTATGDVCCSKVGGAVLACCGSGPLLGW